MTACPCAHPAPEPRGTGDVGPSVAERARTVATRPAATASAPGVQCSRLLAHAVTAAQVLLVVPSDGDLASTEGDELRHEVPVDGGSWLAAAAYGGDDPHTPGAPVFAHTTPLYVDVAGRRVARASSAAWCLDALDALEGLVTAEGRLDPERRTEQLGDLVAVVDRARAFYRGIAEPPAP